MKFPCSSASSGPIDEHNSALSTPSRTGAKLSGRARSPCTTSTPGKAENIDIFWGFRTSARHGTPEHESNFTISMPLVPVAPVMRIIMASVLALGYHRVLERHNSVERGLLERNLKKEQQHPSCADLLAARE